MIVNHHGELSGIANSNQNSTRATIVGIGCRFPGGANNPKEFWD
jgi:hypothetical protein